MIASQLLSNILIVAAIFLPLAKATAKDAQNKSLPAASSATARSLLQGKWKADGYLHWVMRSGKLVELKEIKLEPEHFGYLLFDPQQTLSIQIESELKPNSDEERKANEITQSFDLQGSLTSDRRILNPACEKVPYYKTHFACLSSPAAVNPLKFNVTFHSAKLFSQDREFLQERFKKNGVKSIRATVMTANADNSSGGALLMYVGDEDLLLETNYSTLPRSPDDAMKSKCPSPNTCGTTALRFRKVK